MDRNRLWEECVRFHGHACGGLAIGFQAALYAEELLEQDTSEDEELVCIAENDACGVDAIQYILSCTAGKGNLMFHITGKQAWSFYNRNTGKSFRLRLRNFEFSSKQESLEFYRNSDCHDLFDVMETRIILPRKARIFRSVICEGCGEKTAEHCIRLENGRMLCPDCFEKYTRPLI